MAALTEVQTVSHSAKTSEPARWGVFIMRKQAERLGSVEAKDEAQALQRAYAEFAIVTTLRWRISVQRE